MSRTRAKLTYNLAAVKCVRRHNQPHRADAYAFGAEHGTSAVIAASSKRSGAVCSPAPADQRLCPLRHVPCCGGLLDGCYQQRIIVSRACQHVCQLCASTLRMAVQGAPHPDGGGQCWQCQVTVRKQRSSATRWHRKVECQCPCQLTMVPGHVTALACTLRRPRLHQQACTPAQDHADSTKFLWMHCRG